MARKYAYHAQHLVTDNEDASINYEIFGRGVAKEINKAIKVIEDFAKYDDYIELKKRKNEIIAELRSCRCSGEPSEVLRKVRRRYL